MTLTISLLALALYMTKFSKEGAWFSLWYAIVPLALFADFKFLQDVVGFANKLTPVVLGTAAFLFAAGISLDLRFLEKKEFPKSPLLLVFIGAGSLYMPYLYLLFAAVAAADLSWSGATRAGGQTADAIWAKLSALASLAYLFALPAGSFEREWAGSLILSGMFAVFLFGQGIGALLAAWSLLLFALENFAVNEVAAGFAAVGLGAVTIARSSAWAGQKLEKAAGIPALRRTGIILFLLNNPQRARVSRNELREPVSPGPKKPSVKTNSVEQSENIILQRALFAATLFALLALLAGTR